MRTCELDGALGGDLSFEVLKCGGLHLVVTGMSGNSRWSRCGQNLKKVKRKKKKKMSCTVRYLSEGLRRV